MANPNSLPTLRQALRQVRADLAETSYLPAPREYATEKGTLFVRNRPCEGGGLLGVFEAELVGSNGQTIRRYPI